MDDLVLHSSLTPGEIEENFKDFDLYAGIMQGLKEALAYQRGDHYHCSVSIREIPDTESKDI